MYTYMLLAEKNALSNSKIDCVPGSYILPLTSIAPIFDYEVQKVWVYGNKTHTQN